MKSDENLENTSCEAHKAEYDEKCRDMDIDYEQKCGSGSATT